LRNWAAEALGLEKSPESGSSPIPLKNNGLPANSALERDPNLLEKPLGNMDLPPSSRNVMKDGIEKENVLLNDISNQVIFLLKQFSDQMDTLTSNVSNMQNVNIVAPSTTNNNVQSSRAPVIKERGNLIPARGY
jgi:hypothetical protein